MHENAIRIMSLLRYDDRFQEALEGTVLLEGAGGLANPDVGGGACPGYAFVSNGGIPAAEIRAWMDENVPGPFTVQFIQGLD